MKNIKLKKTFILLKNNLKLFINNKDKKELQRVYDELQNSKNFLESRVEEEVIMITAEASLERLLKSHKYNAYNFITKPINLNELEQVSKKALSI